MDIANQVTGAAFRRGAPAVVGGLLWMPYGVLELLEPLGHDVRYDERLGYAVVLDRQLFVLYSLPGALALLLCAVALLLVLPRPSTALRGARGLACAAAALGVVSTLGVAAAFDPAFTAGRVAGTVLLGAAVLLTATRARGPWRAGLVALGTVTVSLLPVWPLVFALHWLSPGAGAAVLALHGVAWVIAGAAAAGPRALSVVPHERTGAAAALARASALSPVPTTPGGAPCSTIPS